MGKILSNIFFVYLTKLFNEAGKCDIGFYGSEFFMVAQCIFFFFLEFSKGSSFFMRLFCVGTFLSSLFFVSMSFLENVFIKKVNLLPRWNYCWNFKMNSKILLFDKLILVLLGIWIVWLNLYFLLFFINKSEKINIYKY